jgi:hypothetical protein
MKFPKKTLDNNGMLSIFDDIFIAFPSNWKCVHFSEVFANERKLLFCVKIDEESCQNYRK